MGRKSIVIKRPVHEVFARVTDLERAREWAPQMGKIRVDGPLREGATLMEERRMFGRTVNAKWVITRFEPDRVMGLDMKLGPMWGRFTYEFAPASTGTQLTQSTDMGFSGPLKVFSGIIAAEAQKEEDAELDRIKEILERG
jgi:hypothetical protein